MSDFRFLKSPTSGKWVVLAPKRAKRPGEAKSSVLVCPFEGSGEPEEYRLNDVVVVKNKFPFAPVHEVVILSSDHEKSFESLPLHHVEDIVKVYFDRYNEHKSKGQVYIFSNHGKDGGETLTHPHSQIAVIPNDVELEIPVIVKTTEEIKNLTQFYLYCPNVSQWPDEVWAVPHRSEKTFGEASEEELKQLSFIIWRLIQIMDVRHGANFSYNFYIYPGKNWYFRLIPRAKLLGGFEVGTNVFVNTQVPSETFEFIKEHFDNPDLDKIKNQHYADYLKGA